MFYSSKFTTKMTQLKFFFHQQRIQLHHVANLNAFFVLFEPEQVQQQPSIVNNSDWNCNLCHASGNRYYNKIRFEQKNKLYSLWIKKKWFFYVTEHYDNFRLLMYYWHYQTTFIETFLLLKLNLSLKIIPLLFVFQNIINVFFGFLFVT